MNYQQLKEFTSKLNIERTEIPLNALKLAKRLNIPYENENVPWRISRTKTIPCGNIRLVYILMSVVYEKYIIIQKLDFGIFI